MADHHDDGVKAEHVWVRYIIMPVKAFRGDDGEPYLEYDPEEIKRVIADPDLRVGCLICNELMDDAWDHPCAGPKMEELLARTE